MTSNVLVLNADYRPCNIWTWQKAMSELLQENSTVSVLYGPNGKMISHNFEIRDGKGNVYEVPSILVLKSYVEKYNKDAVFSKRNVYARDLGKCGYCGRFIDPKDRTIDHIIPQSHWNPKRFHFKLNSFENAVTCCRPCNFKKRNRTPNQAGMKLLINPKRITKSEAFINRVKLMSSIPEQWKGFLDV